MVERMASLSEEVAQRGAAAVARLSGAELEESCGNLTLAYWGRRVRIEWPHLAATWADSEKALSTYDTAMLVYYLHTADGTQPVQQWVGFRDLPDGKFYHQAFQGYSGNRLAAQFGDAPSAFEQAATRLHGRRTEGLGTYAFEFQALPRVSLLAILWPGDDEFAARGQILFDASVCHYLTIDGCAMIGSNLVSRLIRAGNLVG